MIWNWGERNVQAVSEGCWVLYQSDYGGNGQSWQPLLRQKRGGRWHHLVDTLVKEKRWVAFKGEDDPTSIPVEWICWLNGQRKRAPTQEELAELEARRERVRQNVALLKKEEEERKARECSTHKIINTDKVGGSDLKSFIRQFPGSSEGGVNQEESVATEGVRNSKEKEAKKAKEVPESPEPTGSGQTFRPGTWQPPT